MKIVIEEILIAKAQRISGIKSKKEVIENALELYIRLKSQKPLRVDQ
ncbi:type II toxin-antitoxin system VapB family antitoxin [Mucilaginibacter sp.]